MAALMPLVELEDIAELLETLATTTANHLLYNADTCAGLIETSQTLTRIATHKTSAVVSYVKDKLEQTTHYAFVSSYQHQYTCRSRKLERLSYQLLEFNEAQTPDAFEQLAELAQDIQKTCYALEPLIHTNALAQNLTELSGASDLHHLGEQLQEVQRRIKTLQRNN